MRDPHEPTIVDADHPSIDGAIDHFLTELSAERRFLGPSGSADPTSHRSLVDALTDAAGGFRSASIVDGRVIALARVDRHGDLRVAVTAHHRGQGVGIHLVRHVVERARARGTSRLCLRSSRRSPASLALATRMGCMVVDRGRGRLDLVLDFSPITRSA